MDRAKVIKDLKEYRDREFVKEGITVFDNDPRYRKLIIGNALALLKDDETLKQPEIVRCNDCKYGKINDCEEFTTCYNKSSCLYGNTRKSNWWCADGVKKVK